VLWLWLTPFCLCLPSVFVKCTRFKTAIKAAAVGARALFFRLENKESGQQLVVFCSLLYIADTSVGRACG
jgi:hypothetical protein